MNVGISNLYHWAEYWFTDQMFNQIRIWLNEDLQNRIKVIRKPLEIVTNCTQYPKEQSVR